MDRENKKILLDLDEIRLDNGMSLRSWFERGKMREVQLAHYVFDNEKNFGSFALIVKLFEEDVEDIYFNMTYRSESNWDADINDIAKLNKVLEMGKKIYPFEEARQFAKVIADKYQLPFCENPDMCGQKCLVNPKETLSRFFSNEKMFQGCELSGFFPELYVVCNIDYVTLPF